MTSILLDIAREVTEYNQKYANTLKALEDREEALEYFLESFIFPMIENEKIEVTTYMLEMIGKTPYRSEQFEEYLKK